MVISGATARSGGKRAVMRNIHGIRGLLISVLGLNSGGRTRVGGWYLLGSIVAANVHHGGTRRDRVFGDVVRVIGRIVAEGQFLASQVSASMKMAARRFLGMRKRF
jgi:hypothetical protein